MALNPEPAMHMPMNAVQSAAAALSDAISGAPRLARLPGPGPGTLAEAYAVQDAVLRATGPRGGWKVSPLREGTARCSPIPARFFAESPAVFDAEFLGNCLAEVEIAVRFSADPLAGGVSPTPESIAGCIAGIHPAIELLSSRFAVPDDMPDLHRLADLQGCAAVILGPPTPRWSALEFATLPFALSLSGREVPLAPNSPTTRQTLDALCWLARHAAERGTPLDAGEVVITGARLGPVGLRGETGCRASIGPLGAVAVSTR